MDYNKIWNRYVFERMDSGRRDDLIIDLRCPIQGYQFKKKSLKKAKDAFKIQQLNKHRLGWEISDSILKRYKKLMDEESLKKYTEMEYETFIEQIDTFKEEEAEEIQIAVVTYFIKSALESQKQELVRHFVFEEEVENEIKNEIEELLNEIEAEIGVLLDEEEVCQDAKIHEEKAIEEVATTEEIKELKIMEEKRTKEEKHLKEQNEKQVKNKELKKENMILKDQKKEYEKKEKQYEKREKQYEETIKELSKKVEAIEKTMRSKEVESKALVHDLSSQLEVKTKAYEKLSSEHQTLASRMDQKKMNAPYIFVGSPFIKQKMEKIKLEQYTGVKVTYLSTDDLLNGIGKLGLEAEGVYAFHHDLEWHVRERLREIYGNKMKIFGKEEHLYHYIAQYWEA